MFFTEFFSRKLSFVITIFHNPLEKVGQFGSKIEILGFGKENGNILSPSKNLTHVVP